MPIIILQILAIFFLPYLLSKMTHRFETQKILSPVVLCYGIGILLGNLPFWDLNELVNQNASKVIILLAIPLLMFSTNLAAWFQNTKSTILSFFLCILSGVLISIGMGLLFHDQIENVWIPTGMLTGIFTGSAPNLNAIGIALSAPEKMIVYLNATDIICGGVLLIFLTSVAHTLYGKFLPSFESNKMANAIKDSEIMPTETRFSINFIKNNSRTILQSFLLAILILVASVGITLIITGELKSQSIIILSLTTLSVLASFSKKIQHWNGSFEFGEYLLLMFCIAIGMLADFSMIFKEGGTLLMLTGGIMYGTLLLHLLLSYFFKIDRDTTMITSTAALYGPAFVGQIASTIKNRALLFSGMATGLVGYAIGNFLGIGVAKLLEAWLF